jgi:type II secretory pathway component PulC
MGLFSRKVARHRTEPKSDSRSPNKSRRCVPGLVILGFLQTSPEIPPYSTLPLDLVGVIVNTTAASNSVCLVRCKYPSKLEEVFRPGQKAFDFAEIREIRRDGVIIQNLITNNPEYLTFQKNKPIEKTLTHSPIPRILAKSSDRVNINLPKDTVNHYLNNLPDLLDSAFAAPRYREGKNGEKTVDGFEISRIKEAGIVEQLGLKNGDVILTVNDEPLDGMATVMRLLSKIQNESQVKMTILRSGQKMNFIFDRK